MHTYLWESYWQVQLLVCSSSVLEVPSDSLIFRFSTRSAPTRPSQHPNRHLLPNRCHRDNDRSCCDRNDNRSETNAGAKCNRYLNEMDALGSVCSWNDQSVLGWIEYIQKRSADRVGWDPVYIPYAASITFSLFLCRRQTISTISTRMVPRCSCWRQNRIPSIPPMSMGRRRVDRCFGAVGNR